MTVKSKLLEILEQHKGVSLSGEQLAENLGCTRAAIWKAVKSLKEEGYDIQAVPNRGYALSQDSNFLSVEALKPFLDNRKANIRVYDSVESTNREARRFAMEEEWPHGSAVISRSQTLGKGRRGRAFYSPQGGLYISVILRPKTSIQDGLLLTTAAATAVFRSVRNLCGIELSIKWVNDLYREGRKVCGILTEAVTDFETGDIEAAIVGIGLNLDLSGGVIPEELKEKITDLRPTVPPINQLTAAIINELLQESEKHEISPEYRTHNMIPGHRISIRQGDQVRFARAEALCADGRLKVIEEDGTITCLSYGEVSVRQE